MTATVATLIWRSPVMPASAFWYYGRRVRQALAHAADMARRGYDVSVRIDA